MPTAPPRLLIVEPQSQRDLAVLARRLGEAGYRVIACDNARRRRSPSFTAQPVDLVLAELRHGAGSAGSS